MARESAHRESYQVALVDPGQDFRNTIRLVGYDVVIPLEKDMDGDPLQDDRVRLTADVGNRVQEIASSDEDAEHDEEAGVILYSFRDVPPGVYHVETLIRGQWIRVIDGLTVRAKGVFMGSAALDGWTPSTFETGEQEPDDDGETKEADLEVMDWQDQGDVA